MKVMNLSFSFEYKRAAILLTAMLLVFCSFGESANAAAGDLDLGFGQGGKVTSDFSVEAFIRGHGDSG